MKRSAAAGAALAAVLAGGLATASTASNSIPNSTAGHTAITVSGAKMRSISYTIAAGTITGFTVNLKGPATTTVTVAGVPVTTTLFTTVRARFGTGTQVLCTLGLYSASNDQTPATCTGFAQPAARSWSLQITVS